MRDDASSALGDASRAGLGDPDRAPQAAGGAAGSAWERLEDQLRWYDGKSAHNKRWFQSLKVGQIVIAALIPATAAAGASTAVAGGLGAAIVVLEGMQQLFQFQQNWISYRATSEALKHEKFLYQAAAGPYAGAGHPDARLAERVEGLVSQEHAAWTSSQREAGTAVGTPQG
jgi:Protein of unknown function (DUF4231)